MEASACNEGWGGFRVWNADDPNAISVRQERPGTSSMVCRWQSAVGAFVWGPYKEQWAQLLDMIHAKARKISKPTDCMQQL